MLAGGGMGHVLAAEAAPGVGSNTRSSMAVMDGLVVWSCWHHWLTHKVDLLPLLLARNLCQSLRLHAQLVTSLATSVTVLPASQSGIKHTLSLGRARTAWTGLNGNAAKHCTDNAGCCRAS